MKARHSIMQVEKAAQAQVVASDHKYRLHTEGEVAQAFPIIIWSCTHEM